MNSPIASPAPHKVELCRLLDELLASWQVNSPRTLVDTPEKCQRRIDARAAVESFVDALAQLGTGSGAGAQSDSGADSGHATSAVPCLHPSVSEALRDALETFDNDLTQWAQAYPVTVFPEPDFAKVEAVLQAAGMGVSSVSASNMRHVVTTLNALFNPVRAALRSVEARGENAASEALKPCPFCGGNGLVHCGGHIVCWSCGCEGPDADDNSMESASDAWNRRAPTSAAGATKPDELTSSPEPAPALRAADDLHQQIMNLPCDPVSQARLGSNEARVAYSIGHRDARHAAAELVNARASGLLPVAREGLSDEQIKARCKAAGIQWIEPMLDDEGDGYPGGFDMTSMEEMRALLAPASGDAPGEAK